MDKSLKEEIQGVFVISGDKAVFRKVETVLRMTVGFHRVLSAA